MVHVAGRTEITGDGVSSGLDDVKKDAVVYHMYLSAVFGGGVSSSFDSRGCGAWCFLPPNR